MEIQVQIWSIFTHVKSFSSSGNTNTTLKHCLADPVYSASNTITITNTNTTWKHCFADPVFSAGNTITITNTIFCRSGPISWRLLPSGRAVSVYGDGKGFIVKVNLLLVYLSSSLKKKKEHFVQTQVHDNLGFKFRSSHYNSAGTVKGDKLCMDASETRVVVSEY